MCWALAILQHSWPKPSRFKSSEREDAFELSACDVLDDDLTAPATLFPGQREGAPAA